MILVKTYSSLPIDRAEILRYAGCKAENEGISALIKECLDEVLEKLKYKVCYCELSVATDGDICNFGSFSVKSGSLAKALTGCGRCIVFAATVGLELDRLISKYGRLSPSKALIFQAIGAERIESLCDAFCKDIAHEYGAEVKPRVSAGYGDIPLECQKNIFAVLEPEKRIGLTLSESLLMMPSKSVTAFVGIKE